MEYLAAERESEIRSLCYGEGLKEEGLKEEVLSRCEGNVPIARSRHRELQMGWN